MENTSFDADGKLIKSTVSIGISTYPDEVGNVFELLEKADEALYECKRSGRNSVTSYSSAQVAASVEHVSSAKLYEVKQGGSRKTDKS